ncbi:MAG: YggS family pyridoxal phosphate-dependent enzyme [Aliidiomarina sp.]|uniref:YggS family pyridoxal phosphate-dependent enzyme n=1 Tax=Aliidiomarina sp. TaxID=1872439 RepID=UPI0025BF0229|nr:YggS family pyridoxal phosphate-dependent enzyme [Aliidiomarina sp.]MCH8502157.1 YggS family pyridoxal phosphate-dependent enzyme [Aliidiomarina sp.]
MSARFQLVSAQIDAACEECQRPQNSVKLLAVSKTKPATDIAELYQYGQRAFGENYVQEGIEKINELAALTDLEWHFIGPLQSNKTKDVAEHFTWMQSLDREKIARRLNDQRPLSLPPLQVLIQVNIDDEESKSGVALANIAALAQTVEDLPRLTLRGLMAIPAANATAEQQAQSYSTLYDAFLELQQSHPTVDTLSLGMSNDLEAAVRHGSTMVRIGTALFGAREK